MTNQAQTSADEVPFAMFRHNGEVVCLNERQTLAALGSKCACGACLDCRTKEYVAEASEQ